MMAKVALLLTQGFADWEYALIAGTGRPFYGIDIQFFAPEAGEIHSQGGLATVISHTIENIPEWSPNAVVIIGGTIWTSEDTPDVGELLKTQHSKGGIVAGICGGTLPLARAGLLNEVSHTSNDAEFLNKNAAGYSGSEQFCASVSAISDNRVITAPGTAPVSFTAAIFESIGIDGTVVKQFREMMAAEHV
nr:DJ-1/PfpI family protein [uncultured Pseudodesulfovibrio sp.]